jgi:hypothetical protein
MPRLLRSAAELVDVIEPDRHIKRRPWRWPAIWITP